ncbi:MAG TPA: Glu/Leu/Phe/Val dehydrogenase [Bacteroidia bacterium]|nr:Glu/Leu/Phe/Val dehydrogenase [Bacteroidia bacterium]
MIETKEVKKTSGSVDSGVTVQMSTYNHEEVLFCNDNATGLKAIIAVHNTVLGPSLGGCRIWKYGTEQDALNDVLRLSRGMTYKASVAGLNLGGGKSVIIGDAKTIKNEALMRRFGRFVDDLGGKYITAEDVGSSSRDMEYIRMETKHVTGIPESMGGSGDPSPVTAYGVLLGMKAAANEKWGNDSLKGKKVSVQGIGNVGEYLVKLLSDEGAKVYITDINEEKLKEVAKTYKAEVVALNAIYDIDVDIYAPCALGATVNNDSLARLKCSIIAGSANNQLADEKVHGEALVKQGIIYAPDFVINSGGLINVYTELGGNYNKQRAMQHADKIYDITKEIFRIAKQENIPTYLAANKVAEKRIEAIGKVKLNH